MMDIQEKWEKALENTEIIRPRIQELSTFSHTDLPYILLSESSINIGDSVVRKGSILVEKPSLILPLGLPRFEGFDFENESDINEDMVANFLIVRGIRFPSLKYNNRTYSLDIFEGRLKKAIESYQDKLQREEDVATGLIVGPEDCWQFSVLIFVCTQVIRSADGDIRKLLDEFKKRDKH
jgi:hypothetical protein